MSIEHINAFNGIQINITNALQTDAQLRGRRVSPQRQIKTLGALMPMPNQLQLGVASPHRVAWNNPIQKLNAFLICPGLREGSIRLSNPCEGQQGPNSARHAGSQACYRRSKADFNHAHMYLGRFNILATFFHAHDHYSRIISRTSQHCLLSQIWCGRRMLDCCYNRRHPVYIAP